MRASNRHKRQNRISLKLFAASGIQRTPHLPPVAFNHHQYGRGDSMPNTYDYNMLLSTYGEMTDSAIVQAHFITDVVGGQSADQDGVEAFVRHHLKLTDYDENGKETMAATNAVKRILGEEVAKEKRAEDDPIHELEEDKLSYGVTVIRHDDYGPWLGDWMVKACIKAAATRAKVTLKKGVKGDIIEMGKVSAHGFSLIPGTGYTTQHVHLIDPDNLVPARTFYRQFKGRPNGPHPVSIVSDKECAGVGTRFAFEFRWGTGILSERDMVMLFAAAQNIGLGSCKAFECGKFAIDSLELEVRKPREATADKPAAAKGRTKRVATAAEVAEMVKAMADGAENDVGGD